MSKTIRIGGDKVRKGMSQQAKPELLMQRTQRYREADRCEKAKQRVAFLTDEKKRGQNAKSYA